MVKKAKNKNVPLYQHDSPDFWAFTTILVFPVAMLGALSFGFSSTSAFFLGIYASLGALVANAIVERCYKGNAENDGIHLLGPLANCVIRISPPMCMTDEDAKHSLQLLFDFVSDVAKG